MLITRRSMFTGKIHEIEVPCTEEQLRLWQSGVCIQKAMPNISAELREFVKTGVTPEEWNAVFGTGE